MLLSNSIAGLCRGLFGVYSKLLVNFTGLQDDHIRLQAAYEILNMTYSWLSQNYSSLERDLGILNSSHIKLRADYDELNSSCSTLNATLTSVQNDLSLTRDLVFGLVSVTAVLIIAVAYFVVKKPTSRA